MNPNLPQPADPGLTGLATPSAMPVYGNPALAGNVSAGQDALNQLNSSRTTQTAHPSGPSGFLGVLSRLAPTIGGIGGGILGGLADAATLGAAAPLINPITGAAAGGALGQGIQNAAEGKKVLEGNDITTGLESGAGQAGGELLGKGLQAGGKFLTGQGEKLAQGIVDKSAPSSLDEATAINNNYGVSRGVQSANNLQDNLNLMKSFGLDATNPLVMNQTSKAGLFLNDMDNTALAQGEPLSTPALLSSSSSNLNGNLRDAVTQATPQEQQALQDAGLLTNVGTVPETVTPVQANEYARSLNDQLRDTKALRDNALENGDATGFRALDKEWKQLNTTYQDVQGKIGTPSVDSIIAGRTVTPEEKQNLIDLHGPQVANHIEEQANNAQSHADLVKSKLPFAQMNTVSQNALKDLQAPATPQGVARAKQATAAGSEAPKSKGLLSMLPTNARGLEGMGALIEMAMGHPAEAMGLGAVRALSSPEGMQTGGSILSKIGGSALPGAAGALVGASPSTIQPMQGGSTMPDMNGNLQNSALDYALTTALQQARTPYLAANSPLVGDIPTLVAAARQAEAAQTQAQNLEGMYSQAGGAQGPVLGLLSQLGQTFTGGPASLINNQLGAQTQATGQALGAAGAAPGAMPNITENPETANQALIGIRNLLSTLGGGQYSPSSLGSL